MADKPNSTKAKHLLAGEQAEATALLYLQSCGLKLVEQNFRCRMGEIDLIMLDQQTLVFIEVRYRKSSHFGGAAASIDYKKQQKLLKASQFYLLKHPVDKPMRFDVVALEGNNEPNWIKGAFSG